MSNPERWRRFRRLPVDIKTSVTQLASHFPETDIQLAYLFGSLARGEVGQDVDLGILTDQTPVYQLRPLIVDWLQTERLDLVDLKRTPPPLRFQIISQGLVIYTLSEQIENEFELRTLQLYRDTAFLRRRHSRYLRERMATWSSMPRQSPNA